MTDLQAFLKIDRGQNFHHFPDIFGAQLSEDVFAMRRHCIYRDVKDLAYFFRFLPFQDKPNDLTFLGRHLDYLVGRRVLAYKDFLSAVAGIDVVPVVLLRFRGIKQLHDDMQIHDEVTGLIDDIWPYPGGHPDHFLRIAMDPSRGVGKFEGMSLRNSQRMEDLEHDLLKLKELRTVFGMNHRHRGLHPLVSKHRLRVAGEGFNVSRKESQV